MKYKKYDTVIITFLGGNMIINKNNKFRLLTNPLHSRMDVIHIINCKYQ